MDFPAYKQASVNALVPYARNSRTHSDAQIDKIAASIREFGFLNPVITDGDNGIVAGHGRIMAAQKLGMDEVPVVEAAHLTEAQKRAYVIADNRLALDAGWDDEMLRVEFAELKDAGFDLDLTGFTPDEIDALQLDPEPDEGLTDEDAVPDEPEQPVTVEGDVWVLGRHRLICGDGTSADNWDSLNVGDHFVCMTSPPYNLGKAAKLSGNAAMNDSPYGGYSDDVSADDYQRMLGDLASLAIGYCDAAVVNVQPLADSKRPLMAWINQWVDHMVDVITWDKGHAAPHIQPGVMASRYEWLVVLSADSPASRVIPLASWQGKYPNVYAAPKQTANEYSKVHAATFPVHLPEFVIGDLMNKARGVVDPMMGTGTTLIAAEKLGRDCRGIELSPAYCDVIIKRWQDFTGQKAVHEETGKTFDEVTNATPSA